MSLKKIQHYIILILVLFLVAKVASANLEISEINNPEVKANHCWIKVYNNGSTDENLTEWFVMDDEGVVPPQAWHYHKINAADSSVLTLAPSSYAIIADSSASTIATFKSKNPDISGPLFYGSLTFSNSGTMGLSKDKKTIVGQMSYSGTNTSSDGDSSESSTSSTSSDSINSTVVSGTNKEPVTFVLKTTTKIISPKVVVAGIPFSVSSQTTTNKGETFNVGKFVWNFGDGMASKIEKSEQFDYTYEYPGEYVLTLSYFDNSFSKLPTATDRITMKVIPSDVYVSSIGNNSDPFIEIGNKSNYEIILSNWVVTAGSHYFTIPEGTTLLPGKKIKLAPKITGFTGEDLYMIVISNPSGETIATYPVQNKKIIQNKVLSTSSSATYSNSIPLDNPQDVPLQKESQVINLNDLNSSAEGTETTNTPNPDVYPFVGLGVVITIGIMSFLLIRKKKGVKDYVEEGLSAKDMTIIE